MFGVRSSGFGDGAEARVNDVAAPCYSLSHWSIADARFRDLLRTGADPQVPIQSTSLDFDGRSGSSPKSGMALNRLSTY